MWKNVMTIMLHSIMVSRYLCMVLKWVTAASQKLTVHVKSTLTSWRWPGYCPVLITLCFSLCCPLCNKQVKSFNMAITHAFRQLFHLFHKGGSEFSSATDQFSQPDLNQTFAFPMSRIFFLVMEKQYMICSNLLLPGPVFLSFTPYAGVTETAWRSF